MKRKRRRIPRRFRTCRGAWHRQASPSTPRCPFCGGYGKLPKIDYKLQRSPDEP